MVIRAIIGLGNPGAKFQFTRHNIGFRVVEALAEKYHASWSSTPLLEKATISINNQDILLIKPQTFMNSSGNVIPYLKKQGIHADNILVVHDELEKPFGTLSIRQGGSARGHNGLKSIIEQAGADFLRLRVGIGRPEQREEVPNYVLENFRESSEQLHIIINKAVELIEKTITTTTT